jgi:hypothetical protein
MGLLEWSRAKMVRIGSCSTTAASSATASYPTAGNATPNTTACYSTTGYTSATSRHPTPNTTACYTSARHSATTARNSTTTSTGYSSNTTTPAE